MTRASVVAASLLVFAAAGCQREAPEEVETDTVVPVATAVATTGSIRPVVHATGIVTPAPGAEQVVTAPGPARIVAVTKAEGDRVRRGDVLVRFDVPSLAADVAARGADVARAEARVRNADAAQTRARDLFARGVAARREVEDADRELADARADLAQATAARSAASRIEARSVVRAAFDGVVAARSHNAGDLVEAAQGDPVLRVIDPARLEVQASVPLDAVAQVVPGAPAHIVADAGEGTALRVISRPAAVTQGTASVPIRLAFVGTPRLPAGAPVQVEIAGEPHAGVVLVPARAVVREATDAAVFVVEADVAHRRPVVTGVSDGQQVEIRSGLRAGERVVTDGLAGLPDGARVSLRSGAAQ